MVRLTNRLNMTIAVDWHVKRSNPVPLYICINCFMLINLQKKILFKPTMADIERDHICDTKFLIISEEYVIQPCTFQQQDRALRLCEMFEVVDKWR